MAVFAGLTSAHRLNSCINFAQSETLKPIGSSVQSVSVMQCQALLVECRVISVVEGLSRELMALAVASCIQRMTRRGYMVFSGREKENDILRR